MATEKKDPTEADVKWDATQVRQPMHKHFPPAGADRRGAHDALARLEALALLGVQVPGLREQVDVLKGEREEAWRGRDDSALLAGQMESERDGALAEVSALQARVAAAEESERLATQVASEAMTAQRTAESERAALRAQVANERTALDLLFHSVKAGHAGKRLDRTLLSIERHMELRAALSTPPAEEKNPEVGDQPTPEDFQRAREHATGDKKVGRDWLAKGCKCPSCRRVRATGWKPDPTPAKATPAKATPIDAFSAGLRSYE